MYKIIGADGREYGPISGDQLGQWIAEGRANSQTKVLVEGTTDWKTVGEIPEFATAASGAPPPPPPSMQPVPSVVAPAAQEQVRAPAIGLLIVAILGFIAQICSLVWQLGLSHMAGNQPANMPWGNMYSSAFSGTISVITAIVGIATSVLILLGALKMQKLESYGLALTASIIAIIPCISPCCLIGLPIGIWAVVVLSKPEVKSAFH